PLVVPREPRGRIHSALRPVGSPRRARALRRRPEPHQHDSERPRQGDDGRRAGRGEEMAHAGQPHVDRSPSRKRCEMTSRTLHVAAVVLLGTVASAQERPSVGPERPFELAARVEKTLPNGMRVVVTRQTGVPKVSVFLTVLSGYSSDPPELTGLANLTADAIQEGTKTRTSREIRKQAFGWGGSLSSAVSQ